MQIKEKQKLWTESNPKGEQKKRENKAHIEIEKTNTNKVYIT